MIHAALASPGAAALVEECKAVAPRLRAMLAPAGQDVVALVCTRLAAIFGVPPGRTAKHWEAIAPAYYDALGKFPAEALILAERDYRNDPEVRFFPLPGQLRGLAQKHSDRLYAAAYRAKRIGEAERQLAAPKGDPEVEAAAKREALAFAEALKAKSESRLGPARFEPAPRGDRAPQSDLYKRLLADGLRPPPPPPKDSRVHFEKDDEA